MRKFISVISGLLAILMLFSLCACTTDTDVKKGSITVNNEPLSDEYMGYFFYVAKHSMLTEAGYNDDNSTEEDIKLYWETTEIEGKNAVDVARDIAVNNAVFQKIQYLKALSEGITLTDDELSMIDAQLASTAESNGGQDKFVETLAEMGTDFESYKQIVSENAFISKLYELYDSQGKLEITSDELSDYTDVNSENIKPEEIIEYAKKDKFNAIAKEWEKEFDIVIDDEAMKNFNV